MTKPPKSCRGKGDIWGFRDRVPTSFHSTASTRLQPKYSSFACPNIILAKHTKMQPGLQLEDREVAGQAEEGSQEEADTRFRRQRPRVSDSEEPGASEAIAAHERRIAELEARVQSQDALLQKKRNASYECYLERRIAELEARVQSQDALLKKKNAEIRSLLADIGLICVHKSSGITSA